jgi:hypothetical protein
MAMGPSGDLLLLGSGSENITAATNTRIEIEELAPFSLRPMSDEGTYKKTNKNKLRGFSPQSELYRPSDRRMSAKLVPTLADRGCRVVSATIPPQSLISIF